MKRVTTSIKIDPEVLKQAKHLAIDEGITLSELIERALKKEIRAKKK
jgi:antitoxin component of RelBE/YafQ-DinJ toxin-antitoxin module